MSKTPADKSKPSNVLRSHRFIIKELCGKESEAWIYARSVERGQGCMQYRLIVKFYDHNDVHKAVRSLKKGDIVIFMLDDKGEEVRKHIFTDGKLLSTENSDLDYTSTDVSVITAHIGYSKEKVLYAKKETKWVK